MWAICFSQKRSKAFFFIPFRKGEKYEKRKKYEKREKYEKRKKYE